MPGDDVVAARRAKLEQLVGLGVAPYAYKFDRSITAHDALQRYQDGDATSHRFAGRLGAVRSHGKSAFAHLEDASGRIQVYFKQDRLGADGYTVVQLLDTDDIVGVEGPLFRTKTGEVTVQVERVSLLTKSLVPLPRGKQDEHGVL